MPPSQKRAPARGLVVCPSTGRIIVRSPYNAEFVEGARRLRGKWKGPDVGWMFEPAAEMQVRQLHARIYGPPDSGVNAIATAIMVVPSFDTETIRLGSRILIAWKKSLNGSRYALPSYGLALGKGVEMRSGDVTNWCGHFAVTAGTTFLIRDIDPELLTREHQYWVVKRADETVPA